MFPGGAEVKNGVTLIQLIPLGGVEGVEKLVPVPLLTVATKNGRPIPKIGVTGVEGVEGVELTVVAEKAKNVGAM